MADPDERPEIWPGPPVNADEYSRDNYLYRNFKLLYDWTHGGLDGKITVGGIKFTMVHGIITAIEEA